ncbi:MAG: DUF1501 domain-containing protein [Planctomycetota bacterium]
MLDVSINPRLSRWCNGVSRRNFLRVGALAPLGLSLPQLMASDRGSHEARAKSVILIFLGGGLSHHDSFDMKPEAVEQIRGKYQSIATTVPGLNICELLPKTAQVMNKLTLVRSGTHENDHHETATNWVLSGRFGTPFGDHPSIGAIVAHDTGFSGAVPPYVAVPRNPSFTWELGKSVWLGGRCESFKAGNPNDANYRVRDLSSPAGLSSRSLERRKTLLAAVDQLADKVKQNDQIATYDEFSRKAAEMVLSPQAQAAFAIDREEEKTRDEYGRCEFGQSALLARRLVENGVRFVTINYGGWDHHDAIFKSLDKKLPEFDQGYSALINDLDQRGLLDDTLVLTMGEFGRTPTVNGKAGRDHWGRAGSMLWAGAGVARGHVIGATDKNGAFVTERPVRPADVAWTVYESLGIDPAKELLTPEGRPVSILAEGATVSELFA